MAKQDLHREIGRRVRASRQAAGISQEELASRIEMSVETVSNIERGVAPTRVATLAEIAAALGVELAALVGDPLPAKREHPLVEELVQLLAGAEPRVLQAVLDQARISMGLARKS
jgi:transcriptional regulator with XRE-family HTH domain